METAGKDGKSTSVKEQLKYAAAAITRVIVPSAAKYRAHIITGDRRGAGTDSNVYLIILDSAGNRSKVIRPNKLFSNDHEKGSTNSSYLSDDIGVEPPFVGVEVWKDELGYLPSMLSKLTDRLFGSDEPTGFMAWYLDRIEIEVLDDNNHSNRKKMFHKIFRNKNEQSDLKTFVSQDWESDLSLNQYVFPIQRWIESDTIYRISLYDCVLPQLEANSSFRKEELQRMKIYYRYRQNCNDGPMQIANLPSDEKFSEEYYWNFAKEKLKLLARTKFTEWTKRHWKSLDELRITIKESIGEPKCVKHWHEDWWFGLQRVQGVNPLIIALCEAIPEKLGLTNELVCGLMEEYSLEEALEKKKIFICDLNILENLACTDRRTVAAPMAVFYLNKSNELRPIAIQLMQQKGPNNPIFTPKDDRNTWIVAKMYYNNAETQHHQGVTHLGLTHLLMEGICICTHRNLSPSHPMFKLMAPHFLFLMAINWRGLEKLISPGGWVDSCMTQGVEGINNLIVRAFKSYNMKQYSDVIENCSLRGVYDPKILPYYPYRDDAVSLYNVIKSYVSKIVHHYYDSDEKLKADWELKEWRQELGKSRARGGVGLDGVPGPDTGFEKAEEVVDTITMIISTCSLGHSAANFQQYEQYAFVPNYAGILMKPPPTEKITYSEDDILDLLPNMRKTLDILVITKLLSSQGTNRLGYFEMQYMYDPIDVQAAEQFRKELKKLSLEIESRNIDRPWEFPYLNPSIVPNAISI